MTEHPDHERRIGALEADFAQVKADAAASRRLFLAQDEALSAYATAIDANRQAINALGMQTAERFDALQRRVDVLEAKVDSGFAEMRAGFDGTAAGMDGIARMLTLLIDDEGGSSPPAAQPL